MRAFLPAYLVASSEWSHAGAAAACLKEAARLHKELNLPCTFFVRGQTLESQPDDFRQAKETLGELGDFQQCTYSYLPLKTVCEEGPDGVTVHPAGTLRQCKDEVARASDLIEKILGVRPKGLAGPLGYYRGLSDRPEIIGAIASLGITFARTWTRNAKDAYPLAFETQPFRYSAQGFENVLEIPGQGFSDTSLRQALGMSNVEEYLRQVTKDLHYVQAKGLCWSYMQEDWAAITPDTEMRAHRAFLERVAASGMRIMTHKSFAESFQSV